MQESGPLTISDYGSLAAAAVALTALVRGWFWRRADLQEKKELRAEQRALRAEQMRLSKARLTIKVSSGTLHNVHHRFPIDHAYIARIGNGPQSLAVDALMVRYPDHDKTVVEFDTHRYTVKDKDGGVKFPHKFEPGDPWVIGIKSAGLWQFSKKTVGVEAPEMEIGCRTIEGEQYWSDPFSPDPTQGRAAAPRIWFDR